MQKIRQAKESDKKAIVDCIINAFQKDFSGFINQVGREKVQGFLEDSLKIENFYLIENEKEIIWVLALSNIKGRVMYNAKKAAQKHFGFLIGWLMYIVNFREFEVNYCDSEDVGYIEFVGLKQKFQGQGFASSLLRKVISDTNYKTYLLDVVDTNAAAINCYSRLNFVEIKREKVRFSKSKGFNEKIFMEYKKESEMSDN